MANERDEHFAGFAKLLWLEINECGKFNIDVEAPDADEIVTRLIAQRAYDLLFHLLDKAPYHSGSFDTGWGSPEEIRETIEHLPDLTAWPDTSPQSDTSPPH